MPTEDGYMTMREAREYLGISHVKLTQFVREGVLVPVADQFDKRLKLIPIEQVKKLAESRKYPKINRPAA